MWLISSLTEAKILLMAASIWNSVAPESMFPLTMYAIDWKSQKNQWTSTGRRLEFERDEMSV